MSREPGSSTGPTAQEYLVGGFFQVKGMPAVIPLVDESAVAVMRPAAEVKPLRMAWGAGNDGAGTASGLPGAARRYDPAEPVRLPWRVRMLPAASSPC
jgi:hypothetical protein